MRLGDVEAEADALADGLRREEGIEDARQDRRCECPPPSSTIVTRIVESRRAAVTNTVPPAGDASIALSMIFSQI